MRASKLLVSLALVFMLPAWAQVDVPSLETSRRATRCSVIFGTASKESDAPRAREANVVAKRLSLRLALLGASKEKMVGWLNEMEAELATVDGDSLAVLNEDCKLFFREQRELLQMLLDQERIK